jgi:hypothetical protein
MAQSSCDFKSFHAAPRRFALWTGPHGQTGKVFFSSERRPEPLRHNFRQFLLAQERVSGPDSLCK